MERYQFETFFTRSKQALSLVLSACLIWSSSNLAQASLCPAPSFPRSSEAELAPPASLGFVTDSFTASASSEQQAASRNTARGSPLASSPQVILIQDLHAHYGVQKNIASILDFLTTKLSSPAVSGGGSINSMIDPQQGRSGVTANEQLPRSLAPTLPFALAVEGASGPIDSSVMALFPDAKIKQSAADYLMREGELTGAEYFAVMRGLPQALTGVEDMTYYTLHRDLFRKTLQDREQMVGILKGIQAELASLRRRIYSAELKHFQHKIDRYERGAISQADMADWLAGKAQAFGIAFNGRSAEDIQSMAYLLKTQMAKTQQEKDLIQVEHDLALLLKVADLQANESEVRSFGPRLNQFVALATSLLAGEHGSKGAREQNLRSLISSSIDYYAIALMRNKPMVDNTLTLLAETFVHRAPSTVHLDDKYYSRSTEHGARSTAVLVAGGFHTAPITKMLRDRGISYLVITPAVDQLTQADHDLYIKRLSGQLLTDEEILADARNLKSPLRWWERAVAWVDRGEGGTGLATGIYGAAMLADHFLTFIAAKRGKEPPEKLRDFLFNAYKKDPLAFQKAKAWFEKYAAVGTVPSSAEPDHLVSSDLQIDQNSEPPSLDKAKVLHVRKVNLNRLPVGTLVFYDIAGGHWTYTLRIEADGRVSLWLSGNVGSITAPVRKIGSRNLSAKNPSEGLLEEGQIAYMPYFHFAGAQLEYAGAEGFDEEPENITIQLPTGVELQQNMAELLPMTEVLEGEKKLSHESFLSNVRLLVITRTQRRPGPIMTLIEGDLREEGAKLRLSQNWIDYFVNLGKTQDTIVLNDQSAWDSFAKARAADLESALKGHIPPAPPTGESTPWNKIVPMAIIGAVIGGLALAFGGHVPGSLALGQNLQTAGGGWLMGSIALSQFIGTISNTFWPTRPESPMKTTRRDFLKSAGIVGLGVGVLGAEAAAQEFSKKRDEPELIKLLADAMSDLSDLPRDLRDQYQKKVIKAFESMASKSKGKPLSVEDGIKFGEKLEREGEFLLKKGYFVYLAAMKDEKNPQNITFRAVLLHTSSPELRILNNQKISVYHVKDLSGYVGLFDDTLGKTLVGIPRSILMFDAHISEYARKIQDFRNAKGPLVEEKWAELSALDDPAAKEIVLDTFRAVPDAQIEDVLMEQFILHETMHVLYRVNPSQLSDSEIPAYLGQIIFSEHPYFHLLRLADFTGLGAEPSFGAVAAGGAAVEILKEIVNELAQVHLWPLH